MVIPESNKPLAAHSLFGFSQLLFSEVSLSLVKKRNIDFRRFKCLALAHMGRKEQILKLNRKFTFT